MSAISHAIRLGAAYRPAATKRENLQNGKQHPQHGRRHRSRRANAQRHLSGRRRAALYRTALSHQFLRVALDVAGMARTRVALLRRGLGSARGVPGDVRAVHADRAAWTLGRLADPRLRVVKLGSALGHNAGQRIVRYDALLRRNVVVDDRIWRRHRSNRRTSARSSPCGPRRALAPFDNYRVSVRNLRILSATRDVCRHGRRSRGHAAKRRRSARDRGVLDDARRSARADDRRIWLTRSLLFFGRATTISPGSGRWGRCSMRPRS
jgi:hypothetical protein